MWSHDWYQRYGRTCCKSTSIYRNNNIARNHVLSARKSSNLLNYPTMSLCAPGDQYCVSIAKITMRIISLQGMSRCVGPGPSHVLNVRDWLVWKIWLCMRADAIVETRKEDNNETKYPRIRTFLGKDSKPNESNANDKTAQTTFANPQIAQTQSKT